MRHHGHEFGFGVHGRLERAKSEGKTLGRRKVTNDMMTAKIIELRNDKKSICAIASEVGVSVGTVSKTLKVA